MLLWASTLCNFQNQDPKHLENDLKFKGSRIGRKEKLSKIKISSLESS